MDCSGLYWVVLGCTGLYWAALGCPGSQGGQDGQDGQPRCYAFRKYMVFVVSAIKLSIKVEMSRL